MTERTIHTTPHTRKVGNCDLPGGQSVDLYSVFGWGDKRLGDIRQNEHGTWDQRCWYQTDWNVKRFPTKEAAAEYLMKRESE